MVTSEQPYLGRFCLSKPIPKQPRTTVNQPARTQNPAALTDRISLSLTFDTIGQRALFSYHNGTTTPCLSLSVPVPLEVLNPDKSAVLSPRVPPCRRLSLSGSGYEQRRSQVRVLPSALLFFLQIADIRKGPD